MNRHEELIQAKKRLDVSLDKTVFDLLSEWYPLNSVVAFKNYPEDKWDYGIIIPVESRDETDPNGYYQFFIQDIDGYVNQYIMTVTDDCDEDDVIFSDLENRCILLKTFNRFREAYHFLESIGKDGLEVLKGL